MNAKALLKLLIDCFGEDSELICDIITTYLKDAVRIQNEISQAARKNDLEQMHFWVHSLKSAVVTFGDHSAYQFLTQAEELLKEKKYLDGLKRYLSAEVELKNLETELRKVIHVLGKIP